MRFGKCADCKKYKHLKDHGKCSSCLGFHINVYLVKGEEISEALKSALRDNNFTSLPPSKKRRYDNLFEELLSMASIQKQGIRVTERVYRSINSKLKEYNSNSQSDDVTDAITKLDSLSPVKQISRDTN